MAIEANYHAALAGIPQPCELNGIFDGVAAAARREYDVNNYVGVIKLLGPVVTTNAPEDILAMLAESYAWSNRFPDAFELSDNVIKRNRNFAWLYISICKAAIRSHKWDVARMAVAKAEAVEPGSYQVDLFKDRIAERDKDREKAIGFYRDACEKTERDPWPYFFLSRALLTYGNPEGALEVIERGLDSIRNRSFRRSERNFENALMSQQLLALLLVGQDVPAKHILGVLEKRKDVRPEVVVCAAFVRAKYRDPNNMVSPLVVFENALKTLNSQDSRKHLTRQQICYFRATILLEIQDFREAEREFEQASRLDPHNVHVKTCLMDVLVTIAKRAKSNDEIDAAKSAAARAAEIARSILGYDPNNKRALYAQEDLFHEFRVQ